MAQPELAEVQGVADFGIAPKVDFAHVRANAPAETRILSDTSRDQRRTHWRPIKRTRKIATSMERQYTIRYCKKGLRSQLEKDLPVYRSGRVGRAADDGHSNELRGPGHSAHFVHILDVMFCVSSSQFNLQVIRSGQHLILRTIRSSAQLHSLFRKQE